MSRQPEAKEFFSGSLFASGLIKPSRGYFTAPPKLVIVQVLGNRRDIA